MLRYILKRVGQTLFILVLVSVLVFFLMELVPGDPIYRQFGDGITQEEHDRYYHEYGYDQPVIVRYLDWAKGVLRGDFGVSYQYKQKVTDVIGTKIPVTIYLSVVSTLISIPLGIVLGIIVAVKRGKAADTIITLVCNILSGIPRFFIALVLLYAFCLKLKLLPSYGFTFPWNGFELHLKQIILPMICMVLGGVAGTCRQTRSAILEVIRQDYVRTARAKGLSEKKVLYLHVLKNSLIPIVTSIGNRLANLIGGSMFVEAVFSIPGMGNMLVTAVSVHDMPVVMACVMLTAAVGAAAYIVTDVLYVIVDPRISLR